MSHEVVVYLGPARCGKTWQLLREYRDALRREAGTMSGALWLAPTARAAAATREQLIADGLDACLSPGVTTFDDLAATILASASPRLRPTTVGMERELVRRTIRAALESGTLTVYADAARRTGFVDLLLDHIRELRRRGVTPGHYARRQSRFGNRAARKELAALYTAYHQLLHAHQLVDAEGVPWAACDVLSNGSSPRLAQIKLIVIDGFTDFTVAQHNLLSLLAARAGQLLISLPTDIDTASRRTGRFSDQCTNSQRQSQLAPRTDLFAKTDATLAELRRHHPQLRERHLAPRPTNWPAHDHLTGHIFRHPLHIPPATAEIVESLGRIEIVEAASAHDEIIQIARRIKGLLVPDRGGSSAIRPSDIVVVFRALAEAAPRVREVFSQFGIPYALETSERLASTGLVKTLLALLRLDDEDWPFRRTVSVLTNNALTAIDPSARQAADWLVRDLQIAKGRRTLLDRVGQLARDGSPPSQLGDHAKRRIDAARNALPAIELLAGALDALPTEATPLEWADALAHLGAALGLSPFTLQPPTRRTGRFSDQLADDQSEIDPRDALVWQCIVEHFTSLQRLDRWLGEAPRTLSRRDLLAALVDVATHQPLPRQHDEVGRVRILSGPTARTISARHLFLAGMSEQAFPSPERAGRLDSESEYRSLASGMPNTGAPLAPPALSRTHDEMLLFYEVLARAEESLTISYPALDDKAQKLPPSPYVAEIRSILGTGEKPATIRTTAPELTPIPQDDTLFSIADWRLQAVAQALHKEGSRGLLGGLFACESVRPSAAAIDAGLRIVDARARGESFGSFEGLLTSPAAVARFIERFGPQHPWSPSQWETYAACPYKFFLENVLRLEPLSELTLEIDHRRRGSLMHEVLAKFHRKLREQPAAEWDALVRDETRFAAELNNTLQDVLRTIGRPRDGIDAALLELDRRQIEKWIARYHDQHAKYDGSWTGLDEPMLPAHFELRFGQPRPGQESGEDPNSIDSAFRLDIGGEEVLVTGRIDRIDVGRVGGKTVFNVIDYKSGARPSLTRDKIAAGEHLQPALYVMAAEALVFGENPATPLWAGYWSMKTGVTTNKRHSLQCSSDGAEPTDDWQALRPQVVARIREFVHAIRGGKFHVFSSDHDCTSRCDFSTICRISQIRSLNKMPLLQVESQESRVKSQKGIRPNA